MVSGSEEAPHGTCNVVRDAGVHPQLHRLHARVQGNAGLLSLERREARCGAAHPPADGLRGSVRHER